MALRQALAERVCIAVGLIYAMDIPDGFKKLRQRQALVSVTTAAAGRSARQITTQVVGAAEVLVSPGRQGKQHVVVRVPE